MSGSSFRMESSRLGLRGATAGDIDRIGDMFRGNPDFLMLRDLASDGTYDRAAVAHYCESAPLAPGRHLLVIVDRATDSAVGLIDYVDTSPADGRPWIGLVVIHHAAQRQGFGSEALEAVIAALGAAGHPAVHMAVMEANAPGQAFAAHVGFAAYDTATVATSHGTQQVVLMAIATAPSGPTVGDG